MGCRPHLDPMFVKELKQIRREYFVKWNRILNNWEIWGRTPFGRQYMIMRVRNGNGSYRTLDRRTIQYMRWLKWLNQSPDVYNREINNMLNTEEQREESLQRQEANNMRGIADSLYRPYQMLAREMGWVSGKAKIPTVQGVRF